MKRKLAQYLLITLTISLSSYSYGEMKNAEFYEEKAIEDMKSASIWVIEEGVHVYSQKGKEGVFRKLLDEWAVQLWVDPWIESERYIDGFWVKARGINYEIINFQREELPSGIYEFWIVKVDGTDWSGESHRSMFYVVKTDDVYGRREILKTSDQFIESYLVDPDRTIYFSTDDPKKLYEMQAWLYPDNYKESDLKNIEAVMNADGDIEVPPKK